MKIYLANKEYKEIISVFPILCVDGVILNELGEFFLVKRKNRPLKDEWWIPGGRVYKGEVLVDALKRKVKEETGLEVRTLLPLGYYEEHYKEKGLRIRGGVHTISVVFSCIAISKKIELDEQSSDYKWAKELPAKLKNIKPFNSYA